MEKKEITQVDVLQQIAATLAQVQANAQGGANVTEALEKITDTLAGVANRTRPENPEHTGISAYSNPGGDYKEPKPSLQCEVFWVGYPLTVETLTPQEIAALNALKPGNYRVTKGNGNIIPFTVDAKYDQGGGLRELWVNFPCKGDQSTDHRSMVDYCREAMGENVPTLDGLLAELDRVKKQLVTAESVIAAA